MKKQLKTLLYKSLGLERYLKLLHYSHGKIIDWKLFKNDNAFLTYHMLPHIVKEGDYVIDIGANLGYFTRLMARCVGSQGKVIAIEPVKPFFNTIQWALRNQQNTTLYNYALGTENKAIQLSIPDNVGYIRTGLPQVVDKENIVHEKHIFFDATMVRASELLKDIEKIDFIKCDIEGYEKYVIPEMKNIIEKHLPVLQIETSNEVLPHIDAVLLTLGYEKYVCEGSSLYKYVKPGIYTNDFYYLHPKMMPRYQHLIKGVLD